MIFNLTKKNVISLKPYFKIGILASLRGIRQSHFIDNDSVVLQRCSFAHTFFSSLSIDMIFIDLNNRIIQIHSNSRCFRFIRNSNAINIISLKAGKVKLYNIEVNDYLDLNAVPAQSTLKSILGTKLIRSASADATVMPTESAFKCR